MGEVEGEVVNVSRTTQPPAGAPALSALRERIRGLSPEAWVLAAMCVAALVLRLWPVGGGSSEYDEGVYWQSLRAMAAGHPLFSAVFSSQPPAFLLGIYPFYALFGQTLVAARLGIALYSLVGIVGIYVAGKAVAGRRAGLLAAAVLVGDPLYLSMARTLEAEVPAVAWEVVCVALAATAMRHSGRRRGALALAAGSALALGVLTKLLDVVAVVPVALYLGQPLFEDALDDRGNARMPPRALLEARLREAWPALAFAAAGALGCFVLVLLPFVTRLGAVYDQAVAFHLAAARVSPFGLSHNLRLLLQTTGYPEAAFAAGVGGVLLVVRRESWSVVPPLLWLAATFLVLVRQQPLFPHHLVSLAPALALSLGVVLAGALDALGDWQAATGMVGSRWRGLAAGAPTVAVALAAAMVLLSLTVNVPNDMAAAQPEALVRLQMASVLRAASLPSDYVVTDDQLLAGMADRDVLPELVDTSSVRITSGYLTARQLEDIITRTDARYVLFASGRFDQMPGFRTWVSQHFARVADFGAGRGLYIKKPSETAPAPV
jgi:hypothetical protein